MTQKGQHPDALSPSKWRPDHFHQRCYEYEDVGLDKAKRVSVELKINGRVVMDLAAREPGIVALVSRPDKEGIDLYIVEPGGARFIDYRAPESTVSSGAEDWALELLGVQRSL